MTELRVLITVGVMPSPMSETRTLAELGAAVRAEGRPVDLEDAELLVGWENAVIKTVDGWIYRFPRLGQESYERELGILARLAGTLPARTPEVIWTGERTPFAAYRTIVGAWVDAAAIRAAPPSVRRNLAHSLATFLVEMHDRFDPVEAAELAIPTQNPMAMVTELQQQLPSLRTGMRDQVLGLLAAYQECELAMMDAEPVVLHGDFHFANMVLDQPTGVVTGVWDFSCVELGNPASDLRYLFRDPAGIGELVADCYAEITGRVLDVRGAQLIGTLEAVTDALAEGRPLEPAFTNWR